MGQTSVRVLRKAGLALAVSGIGLGLITLVFSVLDTCREAQSPLRHTAYVWNRAWTGEVRAAIDRAHSTFDGFSILVGEATTLDGTIRTERLLVNWGAVASTETPVTFVHRADVSLTGLLTRGGSETVATRLGEELDAAVRDAQEAGVRVAGVQLDYDCPTAKLSAYAELVKAVEARCGTLALSITALPDWLRHASLPSVVSHVDYFVLQLHSLECPKSIDEHVSLCDVERIDRFVENASALRVPFYVALPTYGYEMLFDKAGHFVALAAEGPRPIAWAACQTRIAMAQPVEMAAVIRRLATRRPRELLGIAWFRLPVDGERLNWSWPTLCLVMAGETPQTRFKCEVRFPEDGLCEVWLASTGESAPPGNNVGLNLDFAGRAIRAADSVNGFRATRAVPPWTSRIEGPAPPGGSPVMVAWYRLEPGRDASTIRFSPVEVIP